MAKVDREAESHLEREVYMLCYLHERSDLPVPEFFYSVAMIYDQLAPWSVILLVYRT